MNASLPLLDPNCNIHKKVTYIREGIVIWGWGLGGRGVGGRNQDLKTKGLATLAKVHS